MQVPTYVLTHAHAQGIAVFNVLGVVSMAPVMVALMHATLNAISVLQAPRDSPRVNLTLTQGHFVLEWNDPRSLNFILGQE